MDLLATVRKEGSRGGTGDFKWSDVQSSSRRENYLGHSVMAPVGRWQKNKDLNWYVKADEATGDGEDPEVRAARERKEEIRRVKEAEEDAMARALGLPVPERNNPNLQELGDRRDLDRVLKEATEVANDSTGRGVGFEKGARATEHNSHSRTERIEGNVENQDKELQDAVKEYKRRHRRPEQTDRSRSRSRTREQRHRRHGRERDDRRHSRERRRHRHRRSPSRSVSRDRKHRDRRSERSRSPYRKRREHGDRK